MRNNDLLQKRAWHELAALEENCQLGPAHPNGEEELLRNNLSTALIES